MIASLKGKKAAATKKTEARRTAMITLGIIVYIYLYSMYEKFSHKLCCQINLDIVSGLVI